MTARKKSRAKLFLLFLYFFVVCCVERLEEKSWERETGVSFCVVFLCCFWKRLLHSSFLFFWLIKKWRWWKKSWKLNGTHFAASFFFQVKFKSPLELTHNIYESLYGGDIINIQLRDFMNFSLVLFVVWEGWADEWTDI